MEELNFENSNVNAFYTNQRRMKNGGHIISGILCE